MNAVPIAYRDVSYDYVRDRVGNIMDPDLYFRLRDHLYADFNYMNVNDLGNRSRDPARPALRAPWNSAPAPRRCPCRRRAWRA